MMKRLFVILICALFSIVVSAQEPIYIIGKFTRIAYEENPRKMDGLYRFGRSCGIFYCTNMAVNYTLEFSFWKDKHPSKRLAILDVPIAELEHYKHIIMAEDLLKFKSIKEAYDVMWDLCYKCWPNKIYFIDSSECYKSDPDLDEPDMMKVIQVMIYPEDIPEVPCTNPNFNCTH